ncbi:MAG TPA: GNAT family N-acetyltransferase [Tepidisphaeraceae bacterium]|nr:GNAT family N-acetyltransferase [Tepidisphaeraceae bacterium]
MSTFVLETDRLILRHLEWSDLDALHAILSDPDVMRYIGNGRAKSRQQTERLLGLWIADNERAWDEHTLARVPQLRRAIERDAHLSLWGTVEKRTKQLIGRCGLLAWDLEGRKEVEVGYVLAKSHWGRGYATEIAGAIREYGFGRLGFSRLISLIQPGNVASQRVALKTGMRHEQDVKVGEIPAMLFAVERGGATEEKKRLSEGV